MTKPRCRSAGIVRWVAMSSGPRVCCRGDRRARLSWFSRVSVRLPEWARCSTCSCGPEAVSDPATSPRWLASHSSAWRPAPRSSALRSGLRLAWEHEEAASPVRSMAELGWAIAARPSALRVALGLRRGPTWPRPPARVDRRGGSPRRGPATAFGRSTTGPRAGARVRSASGPSASSDRRNLSRRRCPRRS